MISKEMYQLLKKIPRNPKNIYYREVNSNNDEMIYNLICEAMHSSCDYIYNKYTINDDTQLSLTENGQAAKEEYEQAERNNRIIIQSLAVARIAMVAAVASAIAAIVSFIKMIC